MKKNIYLGLFGIWLMSPPKQQSAQASSPEALPKLSRATEANSQSSSDQGESPDNVDLEKEELKKELAESKKKINQLYLEQLKLISQSNELILSYQQRMLEDLEPETKKRFGIGQTTNEKMLYQRRREI